MSAGAELSPDRFAGTVYRDLTIAADAIELASFHGFEGGIAYDRTAAVAQIDNARAALDAARTKLTGVAS